MSIEESNPPTQLDAGTVVDGFVDLVGSFALAGAEIAGACIGAVTDVVLYTVGPGGVLVLVFFALMRSKRCRKAVARALKRALRASLRTIFTRARSLYLGAPQALAGRLSRTRWDDMTAKRQLAGLRLRWITRTKLGIRLHVSLGAPLTPAHVRSKLSQIETGLGIPENSAKFVAGKNSGRAYIEIQLREPVSTPWIAPDSPGRLADRMLLSVTPDGGRVTLNVKDRIGVFGTSGSGKSCVQRLIAAHVLNALDADFEVWDLKFGVESQTYEGLARRVTTPDEAKTRVEWLVKEEFPRRASLMKSQGVVEWKETVDNPALVVMIDEGNVVVRDFTSSEMKLMFQAVEQGRALGVYFVWATQFPKFNNLPTEIRSQLNTTICLSLSNSKETQVVFEDPNVWDAHNLGGSGWLYLHNPSDHPRPRKSRALFLEPEDLRNVFADRVEVVEPTESQPAGHAPSDSTALLETLWSLPEANRTEASPATTVTDVLETPAENLVDTIWSVLALSEEPMSNQAIADATDKNKGSVSKVLKRLMDAGTVSRLDDGKYTINPTNSKE